jgi:hypothetical protein
MSGTGGQGEPKPTWIHRWAVAVLIGQGMPSEEIVSILGARSPELIGRHIALHRERLEEHLADQWRTLERLEQLLAARAAGLVSGQDARKADRQVLP